MKENENKVEEKGLIMNSMEDLVQESNSNKKVFTTIKDMDLLFNLEGECDHKINDCIGEKIRVKDVLIKEFSKMVDKKDEKGNVIINEETGEVEQIEEKTIVTILIDDNKKSYVTKSKMFAMRLKNYFSMFGFSKLNNEGIDIQITTQKMKDSGNSALSFNLIKE